MNPQLNNYESIICNLLHQTLFICLIYNEYLISRFLFIIISIINRSVSFDFTWLLIFNARQFGYMNGESDWTTILSNVNFPEFNILFIPFPEMSLHKTPVKNVKTTLLTSMTGKNDTDQLCRNTIPNLRSPLLHRTFH